MTIHKWSLFILFVLVACISVTITFTISVGAGAGSAFIGLVGCWLYHALTNDYFV